MLSYLESKERGPHMYGRHFAHQDEGDGSQSDREGCDEENDAGRGEEELRVVDGVAEHDGGGRHGDHGHQNKRPSPKTL